MEGRWPLQNDIQKKRFCVLTQTELCYICHRLLLQKDTIERDHWHRTLSIRSWLSAERIIVGNTLSLHAHFRTRGQADLTYHYRWIQSLKSMMRIAPHIMSWVDTVVHLTVNAKPARNISIKLRNAPNNCSYDELHYEPHRQCLSYHLGHTNYTVWWVATIRYLLLPAPTSRYQRYSMR